MRFTLGQDFGQSNDRAADCLIETTVPTEERERMATDLKTRIQYPVKYMHRLPAIYDVRHLERHRLRLPYPELVQRTKTLLATPELRGRTDQVIDDTGVGKAVSDLMRAERLTPICISISPGNVVHGTGHRISVPKRDLVATAAVVFQSKRVRIAKGLPDAAALIKELMAFRAKIDAVTGHDSYGGVGEHDDLVTAFALAIWWAERPKPQPNVYVGGSQVTI
jgi:hypothetical protein